MISVAIATMNRWGFLKDTLPLYLASDCVKEVVVCDETGADAQAIAASPFGTHPKLKVYVNEKRLGIYQNKLKAAAMTTGSWIAVLDSDNVFSSEWFERVQSEIDKVQGGKIMFGSPDFDFVNLQEKTSSKPCAEFNGLRLNKGNWNEQFRKRGMNFLINDGNFVIPRAALACLPFDLPSSATQAADAIYMLKRFLEGGFEMYYIPQLSYFHLVHPGSTWIQTEKESMAVLNSTDWTIKN